MASEPYNVTWGYSQDTDLQIYTESGNLVEEINFFELTVQSEEMRISTETHNREKQTGCNYFQTIQILRK